MSKALFASDFASLNALEPPKKLSPFASNPPKSAENPKPSPPLPFAWKELKSRASDASASLGGMFEAVAAALRLAAAESALSFFPSFFFVNQMAPHSDHAHAYVELLCSFLEILSHSAPFFHLSRRQSSSAILHLD